MRPGHVASDTTAMRGSKSAAANRRKFLPMKRAKLDAQGRLDHGPPVAVIDVGSNSVRLVVYEGLTRSPTELFNEKALCGLGRGEKRTTPLAAGGGPPPVGARP